MQIIITKAYTYVVQLVVKKNTVSGVIYIKKTLLFHFTMRQGAFKISSLINPKSTYRLFYYGCF